MQTSREGPNPLRPYYKPPSIGISQDTPTPTSSGATHGLGPRNGSAASYASSARDMFSDIDYTDYLSESSPSTVESLRKQVDDWFYKYTTVLFAQPFDVAKTVLQVRSQALEEEVSSVKPAQENPWSRSPSHRDSLYPEYPSDESDPDEPAYFTSAAPSATSYSPSRSRRRRESYVEPPASPKPASLRDYQLTLKHSNSISEVIAQEWAKEGAWGVWKGSNTTFMYNLLLQMVEKWSEGLLSAILNVPDPTLSIGAGIPELANTPYPWASLCVAVGAAVMAGVVLAPLDLIRTKLILTPTSITKRSLTSQVRTLQSYLCPSTLLLPTVLYSLVGPTISHSTPLLLRSHLAVDPVLTPGTYRLANFLSQIAGLFIKLPLETVLRRAQMATLNQEVETSRAAGTWQGDLDTTVKVGEYRGVVATMWMIVHEEGVSETPSSKAKKLKTKKVTKTQKGQGLPGLWRGWRFGMWGLAGQFTMQTLNGGGRGSAGEF